MSAPPRAGIGYAVVASAADGSVSITLLNDELEQTEALPGLDQDAFLAAVRRLERRRPRWVWDDTRVHYPRLLRAGLRVSRSHDLRLCHAILRSSVSARGSALARAAPGPWDAPIQKVAAESVDALFALDESSSAAPLDVLGELALQLAAVADSTAPGALRLLLAAESAGALIAAEMAATGLPWSTEVHDRVLTDALGARPVFGGRPSVLESLAVRIRDALGAATLNPDSPVELIKALRRAGLQIESTRSWELKQIDHPVIAPLLEYKKLARLLSANGWAWLDTWVHDGRFRPDYVVGGVVTGRWATDGGGALQLPKQIRAAVVADPGWKLVVADAAQLEPRILTAMAGDLAMAEAGRDRDLYQGIVDAGVVDDRSHAKVAMLGAMYGATTGESGRLMPRLARAYPRAIALVEEAAKAGERGEQVSTRLGRSSPRPGEGWFAEQAAASSSDGAPSAAPETVRRARARARDWGRFTRNFIVQGSAAEWALCWMADLRHHLWEADEARERVGASAHLVYFLHDEVIVHAPAAEAEAVAEQVRRSAATAGRSLFGDFPGGFPVTVAIVDSYDQAK